VVETGFFGTLGLYDESTSAPRATPIACCAQVGLTHVAIRNTRR
jgi:hypothetical protein